MYTNLDQYGLFRLLLIVLRSCRYSVRFFQFCLCSYSDALVLKGYPGAPQGVGAFAFQDSTGNRYGGTYGLKDGQVIDVKGDYPPPEFLAPPAFQDIDNFFPEYFRNFEYFIQEAFGPDLRNQDLALTAAHKAFDLASNQVGYMPYFDFRFPPFGGFPNFNNRNGGPVPFDMSQNSAFAGAQAGPGFSHHVASINPSNPQVPNVDVTRTHENPGNGGFYSVSSSSYASSSNVDGEVKSHRGAQTKVNNNGVVTEYKVGN